MLKPSDSHNYGVFPMNNISANDVRHQALQENQTPEERRRKTSAANDKFSHF